MLERSDLLKKSTKLVIYLSLFVLLLFLVAEWFLKNKSELQSLNAPFETEELPDKTSINQTFDKMVNEAHFKGTALLIKQGQYFYHQSYGYADAENERFNQLDSIYPIASLQKIITGAMVLILARDGKLTLEDTLNNFYPEIDFSDSITIEQLLTHTSGIMMEENEPEELLEDQESQLRYTLNQLAVTHNKEFLYTNANYTLLAGIISKITGQTYEEAIQNQVIEKLSLKQTYFWDHLPKAEPVPNAYYHITSDYQADPFQPNEKLFSSLLGAGNMYMSVTDFWVFIQSLTDGKLFLKEVYEQLAGVKNEGYQAGMFYFDQLSYSEGLLGGFNTVVYGDQSNQNLVILFANQSPSEGIQVLSQNLFEQMANAAD